MRFISADELDPLTPYANETGVYTDSDEDGIPDVVEAWFSNTSMITDSDYRQAFKSKFGSTLFNEYRWVISYFWTVYNKDLDKHHNRTSAWQNATQWLKDQFNPLIRDRTPPMITTFNLWWEVEYSVSLEPVKVYAHLHLVVRDAGGIKYLRVIDEDSGESVSPDSYGETRYEIDHEFSASLWQAGFGSVHIKVVARDYAGNYISVKKELKGAFEQVLDALAKIWSAIWNTLCKVAEAIMKALDVIWNWLVSLIKSVIQTLLSPIWNAWNAWVTKMNLLVEELIPSKQGAVISKNEWMREFTNLLLYSRFAMLVQGLGWGMMGLEIAYLHLPVSYHSN